MPDQSRAIYWDSCVFLSYINGMAERLPSLEALLALSSSGSGGKIYTSELAQVEVAYAISEREQRRLDAATEERIDALWTDSSAIVLVEVHSSISSLARRFIREGLAKNWDLKPADAIHIATAQWISQAGLPLEEFHTYDQRLFRYGPDVGFNILEPYTPQPNLL